MKSLILQALLLLCLAWWLTPAAIAQSVDTGKQIDSKLDKRAAQVLYEEANNYLEKKVAEFIKKKLPYDPKLEAQTKQEQRDLAGRNAAVLQARGHLAGEDLYYLGMLYHLAFDSDHALDTMQHFLAGNLEGEKAQFARAVVAVHALKKNQITEAERVTEDYSKSQPVNAEELYGMERLIAEEFYKAKDYRHMATHARAMLNAAKLAQQSRKLSPFRRDEMLFNSSSLLAEAYGRLNDKDAALATFEDLRKLALALPSGNLYKLATFSIAGLDPSAQAYKPPDTGSVDGSSRPPDIVASQWIDQTPTKLAELRGHVVLLDFWAPWCGPCRFTFPKLQRWHESYKDKGLVILGLTDYSGRADGRTVTQEQELAYLRDFKKKNHLSYGFVVADSGTNDLNYGVFSIPMSFLIDRNGSVRFISIGANEAETQALGRMIKTLLDESATDGKTLENRGAGDGATGKRADLIVNKH